jgi:hypothetical protein
MADKYISSAKVIDGILILSLPDAVAPVVWQMELGQSKSSALEIRNSNDGQFILTLKTPRQDVLDIATYANRDTAIKALLATTSALEKAQGQLNPNQPREANGYPVPVVSHTRTRSKIFCILKKILSVTGIILGGLVFIGLILLVIGKLFMSGPQTPSTSANNSAPVSADEFLENR